MVGKENNNKAKNHFKPASANCQGLVVSTVKSPIDVHYTMLLLFSRYGLFFFAYAVLSPVSLAANLFVLRTLAKRRAQLWSTRNVLIANLAVADKRKWLT